MRVAMAVLAGLLVAGCEGQSVPDLAPPDIAFFAILEAEGQLPSWYVLRIREFQEGVPLQQQEGKVLWEAEGEIQPGSNETEAHALEGDQPYWVEVHFERTPDLARTASTGYEFHLDPDVCADIVTLRATGQSSLTSWGSRGDVVGCPG